ncbi:hypothetical protein ACFOYW_15525 [Gryllotalpicola reticulitermitis]|uniref:Uncharacterized protein n=1 Tax=Gryllotalpicola reticulitermitis TaxID=1184153 RepID=A0ABV8QBT1_9MICO
MKAGSIAAVVVVACAIAVAAAGIGVAQAAPPSSAARSHVDAVATGAVRSSPAPSSGASVPPLPVSDAIALPTSPQSRPQGAIEYATGWRLDKAAGNSVVITVWGPGSGCTTLDYVDVAETTTTVTIGAYEYFTQPNGTACDASLKSETGTVELATPLGTRTLLHASVPAEPQPTG